MEKITHAITTEVPSWHLEFPLRWSQVSHDQPESIRRYSFRPWPPVDITPPKKARRGRKARRKARARG